MQGEGLLGSDTESARNTHDNTQTQNTADEEIVEVLSLPALCEGDGVLLGNREVEYAVFINGQEYSVDLVVDTSELGVGFHLIELAGQDPELGSVRLQLPLSVISPVEIRVPPVTEIELTDYVNGGIVQVELHNRSQSEHCVRVEMQSMPPGWMALCLGEPIFILKPGETVQIDVQVEEMVRQASESDLLPFTLRAWLPGASAADVFATFHVSASAAARTDPFSGSSSSQIP